MKHIREYLFESILDDQDDIIGQANDVGLEAVMVQRLDGFDHNYIYNDRESDFIKSVEINGNKLTAYMNIGYRRCGFQLYDIDLRYDIILELINEGYDVTLKAGTQNYEYGAIRCNALDYYTRTWDEAMDRMFKLISNPKFHLVDKEEINTDNMVILIDKPLYTKPMNFSKLPKVLKICLDIDDCSGYEIKGAKSKLLYISGLPQRGDETLLNKCKAENLLINSHNMPFDIACKGVVDFSQSTFGSVHLIENNLYLAPYMLACIIPEFDHFHTRFDNDNKLRGIFHTSKTPSAAETIDMMNAYFEDHPELIDAFHKISREFVLMTEKKNYPHLI